MQLEMKSAILEDASAAAEGRQVRKDLSSAINKEAFALERFAALESTGAESWQGAWRWSQSALSKIQALGSIVVQHH